LITDHNVRETLSVTDRAYIIAEGKIFRAGTPHELGNDLEVRRVYLGEGFRWAEENHAADRNTTALPVPACQGRLRTQRRSRFQTETSQPVVAKRKSCIEIRRFSL